VCTTHGFPFDACVKTQEIVATSLLPTLPPSETVALTGHWSQSPCWKLRCPAHNCCCWAAASGDADEEEEEEPLLLLLLLPAGHRCGYAAIPPDDAANRRNRTSLLEGAIAAQREAGMMGCAQRLQRAWLWRPAASSRWWKVCFLLGLCSW
jgi:hypothetical protein